MTKTAEERHLEIEKKGLQLEVLKMLLTFCSLAVVVEIFIISNQSFEEWLKLLGLGIMAILLIALGCCCSEMVKSIKTI